MIFSKKYKYRSLAKKKTNKFYFFFNFFFFFFQSEFFFLVFQKKTSMFDFNKERKDFLKKGFILKKTSSTNLRHLLKKYKPFFKGFINLAFDYHFICYPKKKDIQKLKEFVDYTNNKETVEKYQIILLNYKGRFYSNDLLHKRIITCFNNKNKKIMCFYFSKIFISFYKKFYFYYFLHRILII